MVDPVYVFIFFIKRNIGNNTYNSHDKKRDGSRKEVIVLCSESEQREQAVIPEIVK